MSIQRNSDYRKDAKIVQSLAARAAVVAINW